MNRLASEVNRVDQGDVADHRDLGHDRRLYRTALKLSFATEPRAGPASRRETAAGGMGERVLGTVRPAGALEEILERADGRFVVEQA